MFIVISPALAHAADFGTSYIHDEAAFLTREEQLELEERAAAMSEKYECEIRVITVANMAEYGFTDAELFSYHIYTEYNLGYGPGRDCVILLLSKYDRDYDFRVWGEHGKTVFTFYGIDNILDEHILPELRKDNYYAAFTAYLDRAELYFEMAADGTPFDKDTNPDTDNHTLIRIFIVIFVPTFVAGMVCTIWKNQMAPVKIAKKADNYIPDSGFVLSAKEDQFLYRTTIRTKIESSSGGSSGGASSGSGGSSGRSGKY